MSDKIFTRMSVENPIVQQLRLDNPNCPNWWKDIVKLTKTDKDFNVQVRDNYLSVYCLMRQFMKIEYNNNGFLGEIHQKYIPLRYFKKNYLKINLNNGISLSDKFNPELITNNLLKKEHINLIKIQIAKYAGEEKYYQSKLIEKNKRTILDAEVSMAISKIKNKENNTQNTPKSIPEENTQIDLVHYDHKLNKIVAVELKLIGDPRLYSGEINRQLTNYHNFMQNRSKQISEAYKNTILVKKALGILESDTLNSLEKQSIDVENRILLCIIGYNQPMINAFNETIQHKINNKKDIMLGVYFFGTNGGDLNIDKGRNKYLFI